MHINWFAVTIISIWLLVTIGVIITKDSSAYIVAFLVTLFLGVGYLMAVGVNTGL